MNKSKDHLYVFCLIIAIAIAVFMGIVVFFGGIFVVFDIQMRQVTTYANTCNNFILLNIEIFKEYII